MVGREYWIDFPAAASTTADDFIFIAAPTDAVVFVEEVFIGNDASETSEQLVLTVFRTTTDQSAVGSAITPAPIEPGDAAFGGVVRDTRGGADATVTTALFREPENVLNGWYFKGSYEEPLVVMSPTAGTAGRVVIRLNTAPGASTTFSGRVKIREIGG
jgi:hypothetical protein